MKGVNGAASFATVTRHSRRVANAASSPLQNRRRERRTYQLESLIDERLDRAARGGSVELVEPVARHFHGGLQA